MYKFLFLSFLVLTACFPLDKAVKESYRYQLYIDYRYVGYEGKNASQSIYFEIDSINRHRYNGKVVINQQDTLFVQGIEKGSFYPSYYQNKQTGKNNMLEIWCWVKLAQIPDSITISDTDSLGYIKEKTTLYRRPRKTRT